MMQGYNVLMVYSRDMSRLLMCRRLKDPYKGLSNLVGGNCNFFDMTLYAGEGNIGHMIEQVNLCRNKIFGGVTTNE